MKSKADASKKRPIFKLVFCLVAIIQAGALFCAALGWQNVIPFQTPLMFAFAALGAICLICIIAFGYRILKTEQTEQTEAYQQPRPKLQERPIREKNPKPDQEVWKPPARHQSDGTVLLFDEFTGSGQDNEATMMTNQRKGLRLTWEVDGNPHKAERFDYPVIIGRDLSCNLVVSAPSVSRRHAHLAYENNELHISDMGSSNGTFLNGKRVESSTRIANGDEITLGSISIRLDCISQ